MLLILILHIMSYLTPYERQIVIESSSAGTIEIFELIENVEKEVRESFDEFIGRMKEDLLQSLKTIQKKIYLQTILIKE